MAVKLVTPPSVEPVSLAEAKLHSNVDFASQDSLILSVIKGSTVDAENICRRVFITRQYALYLDRFPSLSDSAQVVGTCDNNFLSVPQPYVFRVRGSKIGLPFPTLQSVESVNYIDLNGVQQTLAPDKYIVDNISEPGCITPAPNTYWPNTQNRVNAVKISFTAGYGTPADVPEGIKRWVMMRSGALFENREEVVVGSRLVVADLAFVDRMLDAYKIMSYV